MSSYLVTFIQNTTKLVPHLSYLVSLDTLLNDELLLENNYFGRNMRKNALFLLKNCKNRPALGARP